MSEWKRKILVIVLENRKYAFEVKVPEQIRQFTPSGEPYDTNKSMEDYFRWLKKAISATADTEIDLVLISDNEKVAVPSTWRYSGESSWKTSEMDDIIGRTIKKSCYVLFDEIKHFVQIGNVRDDANIPILYASFPANTTGIEYKHNNDGNKSGFVDDYYRRKLNAIRNRDKF